MWSRRRRALAVLALALAGPGVAAAPAAADVPRGFLGVLADGPLFNPLVDLGGEMRVMSQAGVGSVRYAIDWSAAQPYPDAAAVPPAESARFPVTEDGVPTDFAAVDRFVALATQRRLAVLPVVLRTPAWARLRPDLPNSPPSAAGVEAYARFLGALIRRYGPRGTFWAANPQLPRRPLRDWQVWNEPAGTRDWSEQPGLEAYAALLARAHAAIKQADPGARVVLAGLVGRSWRQLDELYRRGAGRHFDVAAIHPFSRYVDQRRAHRALRPADHARARGRAQAARADRAVVAVGQEQGHAALRLRGHRARAGRCGCARRCSRSPASASGSASERSTGAPGSATTATATTPFDYAGLRRYRERPDRGQAGVLRLPPSRAPARALTLSCAPMATCLVTGGAGFLGSHLCDELLRRGNRVICVDNVETGSLANLQHIRTPSFRFAHVDIMEPFYIDEPVDFVYHFASPASPIDYLRLPLHTLKVGSRGTHHTLGLAKAHRARFLTASTSEVYGDPKVHPQPESYWGHVNPIGPRGVYDEAKRYAEALTMAYHRQQGVDTAIVRIFNTYGPRMRPHDGRAIPTFLRQALQDRPITVFGDGSQTRSFCYVADLIDGVIRLAESGYHYPVNLGNPHEFTLLELAHAVIEATGSRSEIVHEALPTDDPQVRQPDISLAREILGWEPQIELLEGLRRTVDESGVETLTGLNGR